jgi:probable F420-dependent oxidoreductase
MGYGITIPFDGIPLAEHRSLLEELPDLGYSDVWSSEADGADAFTPLALAAAWAPALRLGTAIVPAYTRGPATLAQSAAAMAEAAPGRFVLGVGTSSDVIVERWNGLSFDKPYQRTRDVVRFLRAALSGSKVDETYETFTVKGFRLARPPVEPPPILVAALRPGMLRLAGREGDGAIINWLGAKDVPKVVAEVGSGKEIVARIFVLATDDRELVRTVATRMITAYLNVPVYAAFHEWLGRGPELSEMWSLWKEGDRKGALAAVPDSVVDDLVLSGTPEEVKAKVQAYHDAGVTTSAPMIVTLGSDLREWIRALAPNP